MHEWSAAHWLPYFRRLENRFDEPAGTTRGRGGRHVNDVDQEGFIRLDQAVRHGRRESAAAAYLRPAAKRLNLEVRCRVHVTDILFSASRAPAASATRTPAAPSPWWARAR